MNNSLLIDYPFSQRFSEVDEIKIRYIDEGKSDSPVILLLHGVPTWSYTFRKIIPVCSAAGNRIIAPDFPGFGMSDKPLDPKRYTLDNLFKWVSEFFISLNIDKVFIFGHDWGVIFGLMIAARYPAKISGIIACNGFLPLFPCKPPLVFNLWRLFAKYSPFLPVGELVSMGCSRKLTKAEKKGYNYPFSNNKEKIAVRILPGLIPLGHNSPGAGIFKLIWTEMEKWDKPFLTVFSNNDSITRGGHLVLQQKIPGTKNYPGRLLAGNHFLQEEAPLEIGNIINDFVKTNL
jgi:haloalkane dehalogenase